MSVSECVLFLMVKVHMVDICIVLNLLKLKNQIFVIYIILDYRFSYGTNEHIPHSPQPQQHPSINQK